MVAAELAKRPIVNARQYAISKLTGQLDTKREFSRFGFSHYNGQSKQSIMRQSLNAKSFSQANSIDLKEKQQKQRRTGSALSTKYVNTTQPSIIEKDESKTSFAYRLERYQSREASRQCKVNESTQQQSQLEMCTNEDLKQMNANQTNLNQNDAQQNDQQINSLIEIRKQSPEETPVRNDIQVIPAQQDASKIEMVSKITTYDLNSVQLVQGYCVEKPHQYSSSAEIYTDHPQQQIDSVFSHPNQLSVSFQQQPPAMIHQKQDSSHVQKNSENQFGTYYTLGTSDRRFLPNGKDRRNLVGSNGSLQQIGTSQDSMYRQSEQSSVIQMRVIKESQQTTSLEQPHYQQHKNMQNNTPEVQELITRADRLITASHENLLLQNQVSQDQAAIVEQQLPAYSSPNEESLMALYGGGNERLEELQRQTEELQRAPDFYNQRVTTLKQKTLELHEIAKNYTSGDKTESIIHSQNLKFYGYKTEYDYQNRSHVNSWDNIGHQTQSSKFDRRESSHQQQNNQSLPASSPREDSSFVKQHDMTSSFLREEQNRNIQQKMSSDLTQGRRRDMIVQKGEVLPLQASSMSKDKDLMIKDNQMMLDQQSNELSTRDQEGYYPPRIAAQRDRSQIYSQQISMQVLEPQANELEMTKKIDSKVLSMGDTYRLSYSNQQHDADSGPTQTDKTGADESSQLQASRKLRRQEKRDRKLQQLKELHDKAQQSMTKIASELTSNGSFYRKSYFKYQPTVTPQHNQSDELSSSVASKDQHLNDYNKSLAERRDSIRSKVEMLAKTRKEIKRLIKIQNKHGKILKQLQKAGVINPNSTIPQESNYTSITEMSEAQRQYQVRMSTTLLQQMHEIFNQLALVQGKLDFEIAERERRSGQMQEDQMSHIETYATINAEQQVQVHVQHQSNRASNHYQSKCHLMQDATSSMSGQHQQQLQQQPYQQHLKNHELSQGTTSTLFWETQMAAQAQSNSAANPDNYKPIILDNNLRLQQVVSQDPSIKYGSNYQAPDFYKSHQMHHQYYSNTERSSEICYQQQRHDRDMERSFGSKGPQSLSYLDPNDAKEDEKVIVVVPPTPMSAPEGTQVTEADESKNFAMQQDGHDSNTITASEQLNMMQKANIPTSAMSGTEVSSNLQGIRVEQLCEILSREISRVREESLEQAQQMRLQYEMELQALRQEFFAKKTIKNDSDSVERKQKCDTVVLASEDKAQTTQTMTEQMVQLRQSELVSRICSNNCTPRTQTISDRVLSMQKSKQPCHERIKSQEFSDQVGLNEPEGYMMPDQPERRPYTSELHQSVFAELQKVKAERDLYYEKLMKVRDRIEIGKNQRKAPNQAKARDYALRNEAMCGTNNQGDQIASFSNLQSAMNASNTRTETEGEHAEISNGPIRVLHHGNLQSFEEIVVREPTSVSPSPDVISLIKRNAAGFQHDFADIHRRNQEVGLSTLYTQDSQVPHGVSVASSNSYMMKPPSFSHEPSKPNIKTLGRRQESNGSVKQQAGKIVHRFRSQQEQLEEKQTEQPCNGAMVRGSTDHVNVWHNTSSIQRPNQHLKDSLVKRCHSCLQTSLDLEHASIARSQVSGRSSTSGTLKNVQTPHAVLKRQSSRDACKACGNRLDAQVPVTNGFAVEILSTSSAGQHPAKQSFQKRARNQYHHDHLTFSRNNTIAGLNSEVQNSINVASSRDQGHSASSASLPSAQIGGKHQMQSMMARPPELIARMAIEQELYMNQMQAREAQDTIDEASMAGSRQFQRFQSDQAHKYTIDNNILVESINGQRGNDDTEDEERHFTLDQDRANKALCAISSYLERYDRINSQAAKANQ